jgi:phosphoribosylformylglycinamidine synthase
VFTRGLEAFDCPSRHGEGKVVFADEATRETIESAHLVPLRYVDEDGQPTEQWPHNPNGSPGGIAGLCDLSGRIFGLMPHPEAYLYPENHPRWIRQRDEGELPAVGLGLHLFANALRAVGSA